jgi:hypothetical protein
MELEFTTEQEELRDSVRAVLALLALLYSIESRRHPNLPAPARLVLVDPAPLSRPYREAFEDEFARRQRSEAIRELREDLADSGLRDKGTVAFRLEPNAQVKLTQIEKALRDHSIKIDRAKSDFGKSATFVFQGGTSADDATHLKEAFKTAKLGNAVASVDSKSKDIHVQVKEGTPDWAAISKVGETLSTPLRLTDVIWGLTPKTAKG